jgi:hypothetical protein
VASSAGVVMMMVEGVASSAGANQVGHIVAVVVRMWLAGSCSMYRHNTPGRGNACICVRNMTAAPLGKVGTEAY